MLDEIQCLPVTIWLEGAWKGNPLAHKSKLRQSWKLLAGISIWISIGLSAELNPKSSYICLIFVKIIAICQYLFEFCQYLSNICQYLFEFCQYLSDICQYFLFLSIFVWYFSIFVLYLSIFVWDLSIFVWYLSIFVWYLSIFVWYLLVGVSIWICIGLSLSAALNPQSSNTKPSVTICLQLNAPFEIVAPTQTSINFSANLSHPNF